MLEFLKWKYIIVKTYAFKNNIYNFPKSLNSLVVSNPSKNEIINDLKILSEFESKYFK
jgi:hypothetical protein